MVWQKIRLKEVIGGKLVDSNHSYLIQQNSDLVDWLYHTIIGKILFWSWIHQGSVVRSTFAVYNLW